MTAVISTVENRLLVNGSYVELGASAEQDAAIRLNGWVVVNAPRPLVGRVTWTGPFAHGTFYAAGPADEATSRSWMRDDAWPVELVTNLQVVEMLVRRLAEAGRTLLSLESEGFTVPELARQYRLPWRTF